MKKLFNTLTAFLLVIIFSMAACKKDKEVPPGPVPPPLEIDTAKVKLKQYETTNLPSPYYHFVYNDSGYATQINFASGFFQYQLVYNNKRLALMTNTINGDKLVYRYKHGNVSAIDEYSGITGARLWHYEFDYDLMQRVTRAKWYVITNNGADSALDKVAELKYHPDGNLAEYQTSLRMDDGNLQWASTYTYNNYDNKTNVDDFSMLKNFFEHLLYLPAVRFQKNNPGTGKSVSTANEFEINYQYEYQQGIPLTRTTTIHQTKGSNAGRVTTSTTQYSYY